MASTVFAAMAAIVGFLLIHVIMALVAIPFALVSPRSGGRAMGIGVAIVIAVVIAIGADPASVYSASAPLPPTSATRSPRRSAAPSACRAASAAPS